MKLNNGTKIRWAPVIEARLRDLVAEAIALTGRVPWAKIGATMGFSEASVAQQYGRMTRSGKATSVTELQRRYRALHRDHPAAPVAAVPETAPEQEVRTDDLGEQGVEVLATGKRIRTVEDLLRHVEADMTRFDIASCQATKYEMGSVGPTGDPVTTELHRVFVKLVPKAGPSTQELIQAMIDGAFRDRCPLPYLPIAEETDEDTLQLLVVADPHIGKYAWHDETSHGHYDTDLATALVRSASGELLLRSAQRRPSVRVIALLGDIYHYDSPQGTTTSGTPLERDGRVQRMIDEGARALFDVIAASAGTAPTRVLLVPGNHDQVLTWALQRILQSEFKHDDRVVVDADFTPRKYLRWGKTLLGFTHGDKATKKLPALMASERPVDWGETSYREFHRGHWHRPEAIETIESVLVRTAPSLSAPDAWHNEHGFVGALRAMESFYYSKRGRLVGMDVSTPPLVPVVRAPAA